MPSYVYVAAQDDDKISIFTMDENTGALSLQSEAAIAGGPSLLAINPDKNTLYVGHRSVAQVTSHAIDQTTGALTQNGSVSPEDPPAYLSLDRSGKFLLSSYYQGGHVAVHPLGADGSLGGDPLEWIATDVGAHSVQTDRSNRFAFVPHIARQNDNVLEPPKNIVGPNLIYQFRFDEATGSLAENSPLQVEMDGLLGPRHYCFHPSVDVVYFSNEQGSSVTAYQISDAGTLTAMQTVSSLPEGVDLRNTCSQIQFSPSGDFLYVPNRGHNSIASFSVDSQGRLTPVGHASTEAVPSAFSLDPSGKFVFAAGSATGQLASYSIDQGNLTPLTTYPVGERPMWVLTTTLGG